MAKKFSKTRYQATDSRSTLNSDEGKYEESNTWAPPNTTGKKNKEKILKVARGKDTLIPKDLIPNIYRRWLLNRNNEAKSNLMPSTKFPTLNL